jgi:DNA polymerase-3 subunit epsilon/exodeoxyribonuclease X
MHPTDWPDRLFVVDTEGNGHQPSELVELAVVPVLAGEAHIGGARSTLLRPGTPITPRATDFHGIGNAEVADAPTWRQIAERVRVMLDGAWIVAHNAHVDHGQLAQLMPGWRPAGVVDTLRLSRHVWGAATRHSLDALVVHAGIDTRAVPGRRHRAGFDAHVTALLLGRLAGHFLRWSDLVAVGVPPGMPGGAATEPEATLW